MTTKIKSEFLLCIENQDCEDLIKGKIYRTIQDKKAAEESYLRIIDESGEDYLYPASYFAPIELSNKAKKALTAGL